MTQMSPDCQLISRKFIPSGCAVILLSVADGINPEAAPVRLGAAEWLSDHRNHQNTSNGGGLTQVGTVWQCFVWLAHWRLRPASSSGTRASRAGQGARPT